MDGLLMMSTFVWYPVRQDSVPIGDLKSKLSKLAELGPTRNSENKRIHNTMMRAAWEWSLRHSEGDSFHATMPDGEETYLSRSAPALPGSMWDQRSEPLLLTQEQAEIFHARVNAVSAVLPNVSGKRQTARPGMAAWDLEENGADGNSYQFHAISLDDPTTSDAYQSLVAFCAATAPSYE